MSLRLSLPSTHISDAESPIFTPLFSLVYISASSHLLQPAELDAILTSSRANNTQQELTGMLLYYDGAFMQVIEGEEERVRTLYKRINRDRRHHHLVRLLEETIPERRFPDWSMGYHRLNRDEATQLEGFTSFAEADHFLQYFQDKPQKSLTLLQSFRHASRH